MRGCAPTERGGYDTAKYASVQVPPALGRLGQPADIADVVAFLASDDAAWVTGQNLRVNGGIA